jgi:hypothetical protein
MARYEITAPDGGRFEVTAPDDASEAQVMAFAAENWGKQQKTTPATPGTDPTAGMSTTELVKAGMGQAMTELTLGAKQKLDKAAAFLEDLMGETGKKISRATGGKTAAEILAETETGIAEKRRLDKPLMATTAGKAGAIAGNVGMSLAAAPVTGLGLGATMATAGAQSALQPTQGEESALAEGAKSAAISGLTYGAIKTAGAGYQMLKGLVAPFTNAGQAKIAGRALRMFAANPEAAAIKMAGAKELVKGSAPTAADVADDAGISTLQKAFQNVSTTAKDAITKREIEQNAARLGALREIAGDETTLAAAALARKAHTQPLLRKVLESDAPVDVAKVNTFIDDIIAAHPGRKQLVTALGGVKSTIQGLKPEGAIGPDDLIAIARDGIASLPARSQKAAVAAVAAAEQGLKTTGTLGGKELQALAKYAPKEAVDALDTTWNNPSALYSVRQHIGDLINAKGPTGEKINEAITRELTVVMKQLDRQITKTEPAYSQFLKHYAQASKPIDAMRVTAKLLEKSTSALETKGGDVALRGEAFAKNLRGERELIKSATGFKRGTLGAIMTPDDLSTLQAVKADLARSTAGQGLARTAGSDTAQNLASQNLLATSVGPTLAKTTVGKTLAAPAQLIFSRAEPRVQDQIIKALENPQYAAQLMQQAKTNQGAAKVVAIIRRMAAAGAAAAPREQ